MPREMLPALQQLCRAYECAREMDDDEWEFSLQLRCLLDFGATETNLRLLVKQGVLDHAHETTTFKDPLRRFIRPANTAFTSTTCFVLTPAGAILFGDENDETAEISDNASRPAFVKFPGTAAATAALLAMPRWDRESRVLSLGGLVIKRFCQRSPNQELILEAFEESGWPDHIDDPLPPRGDSDPKHRLRFTVWRLNRHQENELLRFSSDGTGEGINWRQVGNTLVNPTDHTSRRAA